MLVLATGLPLCMQLIRLVLLPRGMPSSANSKDYPKIPIGGILAYDTKVSSPVEMKSLVRRGTEVHSILTVWCL